MARWGHFWTLMTRRIKRCNFLVHCERSNLHRLLCVVNAVNASFQEPLFLSVFATVVLPGNPLFCIQEHAFEKNWKQKSRYVHLMENSLNRLSCIPSASVFERYLDFGTGSVSDVTWNISQTLCVTNHEEQEGYIQWIPGLHSLTFFSWNYL